MPSPSSDVIDKILEYTKVAAMALEDVAGATQIPFLGSVCSFSIVIISMVQVCGLSHCHCNLALIPSSEYQIPEGAMLADGRGNPPVALCAYGHRHLVRKFYFSSNA
jgi:hypothetical protein